MLGKEAGLWMPTGTMANLLGVFAHCGTDTPRVILPQESHVHRDRPPRYDSGVGVGGLTFWVCVCVRPSVAEHFG